LLKISIQLKVEYKLYLLGLLKELESHINHRVLQLLFDVREGPLYRKPKINLLESRTLLWIVVQLGDSSNIFDPLCDGLLQSSNKARVFEAVLEVISGHVSLESFTLLAFSFYLRVVNQLYLGHNNVLLALYKVYF
jgi:hypothetical protein